MATMHGKTRGGATAAPPASVVVSEKELRSIVKTATTKFDLKETVKEQNDASTRKRSDSSAAAAAAAKNRYAAMDLAKLEEKATSGAFDEDLLTVVARRQDPRPFDVVKKLQKVEDYVVTLDILRTQVANKELQTQRKLAEEAAEAREQTLAMMRDAEVMREEEAKKKGIVKQTRQALLHQLAEREEAKAVQEEAAEQEAMLLARTAREHAAREAAALEAKKRKAREMALATAEANKVFAIREAERRRRDAEADAAIVAYEREKLARETAKEEEKAREKKQRELAFAKMMADAAKLSGKAAEENAARDRRFADEAWRRNKEQDEAARRAKEADKREWLATLEQQRLEKEARRLQEVERERSYALELKANLANAVAREEQAKLEKQKAKALAGFGPGPGATVAFTRPGPPGERGAGASSSSSVVSGTSSAVTASGRSRVDVVQERLQSMAEAEAERRIKEGLRADTLKRMAERGAPEKLMHAVRTMAL